MDRGGGVRELAWGRNARAFEEVEGGRGKEIREKWDRGLHFSPSFPLLLSQPWWQCNRQDTTGMHTMHKVGYDANIHRHSLG